MEPQMEYMEGEVEKEAGDKEVKATPLPYLPLVVLCIIVLSESFSITMIFPFLADMVLSFNLTQNEGEIGFYAGWIASCFNIAQFLSSFGWGALSDRIGRRPVLLIGLGGNFLMIFLFGWSKDLWYAILARSLNGFLNGNIGVVKTYLSEITDNTNVAKGFSIFGLSWGVGLIIGPSIGGFLSNPGVTAPHIFPKGSLFSDFPYLLPCLFSSFVTLIGFILGYTVLKETVHRKKDAASEEKPLVHNPATKNRDLEIEDYKSYKKPISFLSFFKFRDVVIATLLYALLCFYKMMIDEGFAIWAPGNRNNGGLELSSTDLGIVYAAAGVTSILTQFFIFPPIIKRLGSLFVYRWATLGMCVLMCLFPTTNLVIGYGSWAVWVMILTIFILFALLSNFVFVSVMILVNNSSPPSQMGAVNGFAQTWASLLRAVAPSVVSYVLAWSITNGYAFPLNFYFTFFMIGLFAAICFVLTFFLDESIDRRKVEQH